LADGFALVGSHCRYVNERFYVCVLATSSRDDRAAMSGRPTLPVRSFF